MLNEQAEAAYTKQNYGRGDAIDGVEIVPLKRFNDDGGSMTELGRLAKGVHDDLQDFTVRQINFSEMDAGAIKAFHLHLRQTDVWFVPPGSKMLLVLGDCRKKSPTEGVVRRYTLGDGNSRLIRIPPGVAHGVRNLATTRGQIIYFVDVQFSKKPSKCDEGRLAWDHFGEDVWEVAKE